MIPHQESGADLTAETYTYIVAPTPTREGFRYWRRVATAEEVLACDLTAVVGAGTLPGRYGKEGADFVLPPWSVVFAGDEGDPIRVSRKGDVREHSPWTFAVAVVRPIHTGGRLILTELPDWAVGKDYLKRRGERKLLVGSGVHAGILRLAQWILLGDTETERQVRIEQLLGLDVRP